MVHFTHQPREKHAPEISYQVRGDKADYVAQLRVLTSALVTERDQDARQTLADMLTDMLPDHTQLK